MEKITYPLLCYQLAEDSWLGLLVGTDYRVVEKDIKSIKNVINDHLQKRYKKHDDYPYASLETPLMKQLEIKVRPTFREEGSQYPSSIMLKIPLTVVHGENDSGYYECFFPLLNESFYYYDTKQFKTLARHFATNLLNKLTPEKLNRLYLYDKPILDEVSLRVNHNRDYNWGDNAYARTYANLDKYAEKYPYSKSEKRRMSTFPEAAWELDKEVDDIVDRITNEDANILIVGETGTGKSAVLKQAFKKIHSRGKKQESPKTFWRIMPQRITASSKYLGEWEQKVEQIIQELGYANGILWVEDIARLLMIGGMGPEDSVAAFFTSFLRDGKVHMVGEVSPAQLDSMRRMLPGFVENFRVVHLDELPEASVFKILDKFSDYSSQNLKINFDKSAIELTYRLLRRYFPYERFPGKAVRFLGNCISEARLSQSDKVNKKAVVKEFSKTTGLPELFLRDEMKLDTAELENWFSSKVIGQEAAVKKLSEVVKIYKTGLNNPSKPISTLLFAGPTGVGKTASARALADYFFGKGQVKTPLIRIDMSEFRYPGQIVQLIGAGRQVGKLVQEVRERPFAVLLLDEVEKAHPSVFDALLTVLDEGRLVDAYGRLTHFRNVIIIMTSNLGASNQRSLGFKDTESASTKYMSAIGQFFRPEFVNRIDGVVMFNSLTEENIQHITHKELEELSKREGFTKNNIKLEFDESIISQIASTGFDERYGARPLQRAVEREVTAPLANWMLEKGKVENCTLSLKYSDRLEVDISK